MSLSKLSCEFCEKPVSKSSKDLTAHSRRYHWQVLCTLAEGIPRPAPTDHVEFTFDEISKKAKEIGIPEVGIEVATEAFTSFFCNETKEPHFNVEVLTPYSTSGKVSTSERRNKWTKHADPKLVQHDPIDYVGLRNRQRGHLVCAGNHCLTPSRRMSTYSMLNCIPQPHDFNEEVIGPLDHHVKLVASCNKLVVAITGPLYAIRESKKSTNGSEVLLPTGIFKVLWIERENLPSVTQAFIIHFDDRKDGMLGYATTLDKVFEESGFRFFGNQPSAKCSWGTTKLEKCSRPPAIFKCDLCTASFVTTQSLSYHKSSSCKVANKKRPNEGDLDSQAAQSKKPALTTTEQRDMLFAICRVFLGLNDSLIKENEDLKKQLGMVEKGE